MGGGSSGVEYSSFAAEFFFPNNKESMKNWLLQRSIYLSRTREIKHSEYLDLFSEFKKVKRRGGKGTINNRQEHTRGGLDETFSYPRRGRG